MFEHIQTLQTAKNLGTASQCWSPMQFPEILTSLIFRYHYTRNNSIPSHVLSFWKNDFILCHYTGNKYKSFSYLMFQSYLESAYISMREADDQ